DAHQEAADRLRALKAPFAAYLQRRTGQSAETVDTWLSGPGKTFTAEEAVSGGLVQRVAKVPAKPVTSPIAEPIDDRGDDDIAVELALAMQRLRILEPDRIAQMLTFLS